MIKNDFLRLLRLKYNFTQKEAKLYIETLLRSFSEILQHEEKLTIVHFGQFEVLKKKERLGRNPATGQVYPIEKRKVISYRASKKMKSLLNK